MSFPRWKALDQPQFSSFISLSWVEPSSIQQWSQGSTSHFREQILNTFSNPETCGSVELNFTTNLFLSSSPTFSAPLQLWLVFLAPVQLRSGFNNQIKASHPSVFTLQLIQSNTTMFSLWVRSSPQTGFATLSINSYFCLFWASYTLWHILSWTTGEVCNYWKSCLWVSGSIMWTVVTVRLQSTLTN